MKKKLLASILALSIVFPFAGQAAAKPLTTDDLGTLQQLVTTLTSLVAQLQALVTLRLGSNATNPIAGTTYNLSGSGVSASASSITLTSLTIPQTGYLIKSSDLSTNFYLTLEPGSRTRQEIASCTGVTQNAAGTATLTGCSRGLLPFSPFTASSTYQFPHGGGTQVVFSNPPQLFSEFTAAGNSANITGSWIFASSSLPQVSSGTTIAQMQANSSTLASVFYVNGVASSGACAASTVCPGLVLVATGTQLYNNLGSSPYFSVPASNLFTGTPTPSMTYSVPVAQSGTIAAGFISTSSNYTWSGTMAFNGTTTFGNASSGILLGGNASSVTSIVATSSGLFPMYNGTAWTTTSTGLFQHFYNTTSTLIPIQQSTTGTYTLVNSVQIPFPNLNSRYVISGHISTDAGATGSSTLSIAASTLLSGLVSTRSALANCNTVAASLNNQGFEIDLQMANSTTSAVLSGWMHTSNVATFPCAIVTSGYTFPSYGTSSLFLVAGQKAQIGGGALNTGTTNSIQVTFYP